MKRKIFSAILMLILTWQNIFVIAESLESHVSTTVKKEIVNSKSVFYSNDFSDAASLGYYSLKDISAKKSFDSEHGGVLNLEKYPSSDFGFVTYEIGSITDTWNGTDRDTSWYSENKNSFVIYTAAELAGLASLVNSGVDFSGKTVSLKSNVDLNNNEWMPIGYRKSGSDKKLFKGIFDGCGNEIKNLKIHSFIETSGLFGALIEGEIKNVGVNCVDFNIIPTNNNELFAGGILGRIDGNGNVSNCYAKNVKIKVDRSSRTNKSVKDNVGAVIGRAYTVDNCYAVNFDYEGTYKSHVGGIFGRIDGPSVSKCYTAGEFIINTNDGGTNPTRFDPIGFVNSNKNTTATYCYYTHNTIAFKGTESEGGGGTDVYDSITACVTVDKRGDNVKDISSAELASELGETYKEDIVNINEGMPILTIQNMPITDEMNIKFELYIPSDSNLKLTIKSGRNVLSEIECSQYGTDVWKEIELVRVDGKADLYVGGMLEVEELLTSPEGKIISSIEFGTSGENAYVDDLEFYEDKTKILNEILETAELQMLSGITEYPNLSGNLELLQSTDDYDIVWESSNPSILSNSGQLIEQKNCTVPVTLTGNVTIPSPNDNKLPEAYIEVPFNIVPQQDASDEEIVDDIIDYIATYEYVSEEDYNFITKNLNNLPTTVDSATIEWVSTNESVIETDGTVNLPELEDVSVSLIAKVFLNGITREKTLDFKVVSKKTIAQNVLKDLTYIKLGLKDEGAWRNLMQELTLPTKGLYGIDIVWESDAPDVITPSGYLTDVEEDTYVTLTANINIDGYEAEKEFKFVVVVAPTVRIERIFEELDTLIPTEISGEMSINTDDSFVVIPSDISSDCTITWTSSNEDCITFDGNKALVVRPDNTSVIVNLTAEVSIEQESGVISDSKVYAVEVDSLPQNEQFLNEILNDVDFSYISSEAETSVKSNLHFGTLNELISNLPYEIKYKWESHNDAISNEGLVDRPAMSEAGVRQDKTGNITLTIWREGDTPTPSNSASVSFNITVIGFGTPKEIVDLAKDELTFGVICDEPIYMVSSNLNLPKFWKYNTEIIWESNCNDVIRIEDNGAENYKGVVIRPEFGSSNKAVELTAEISIDGEKAYKTFYITVAEKDTYTSHYYENFEEYVVANPETEDNKYTGGNNGLTDHSNQNQNTWVVNDPDLNISENKVLKFKKDAQTEVINGGMSPTMNMKLPSGVILHGKFKLEFKIFIEKMTNMKFRITSPFSDSMEQIYITIDGNGNIYQKNTNDAGTEKLAIGEWNDVSIEFSTFGNTLNVYVNDKLSLENVRFTYASSSTEISSSTNMKFKFVPIDDKVSTDVANADQIVFLDEIKILRNYDYMAEISVAMDKTEFGFLVTQNINEITNDLVFPDISEYAVSRKGKSSNNAVITDDGKVIRPDEDTVVEYTITLYNEYGGERTRTFNLLVKKKNYISDSPGGTTEDAEAVVYDVNNAIDSLKSKYNFGYITTDLVIPSVGVNGSNFSWESSKPDIISSKGVVNRGTKDEIVILTAVATLNGVSERKTIELCVKAKTVNNSGEKPSSSGGDRNITVSKNESGEISTKLPEDTKPPEVFKDIQNHWAKSHIETLHNMGIINGISNDTFAPDTAITREEYLKIIMNAADIEVSDIKKNPFADVDETMWYYKYVMTAFENEIVLGMTNSDFGIGDYITRQDLCTMTARIIDKIGLTCKSKISEPFVDESEIADYAKEAVYILKSFGLVSGKGNSVFDPRGLTTRAEAATIAVRLIKLKTM